MSVSKNALYKWALPLMVLVIGAAFVTLPSPFAGPATRSLQVEPEESAHRHLVAPYSMDTSISIPAFYNSMANVWEPFGAHDTPFLWSIPRTGSGTFQNLIWWCMGKVVAGRSCINCANKTMATYYGGKSSWAPFNVTYLNTVVFTKWWLQESKKRDLLGSGLADVVTTHLLQDSMEILFNSTYKARGFLMMRHPFKRAIDQFFYRQHATWESTFDPDVAILLLNEYVKSDSFIENFVTRSLIGKRKSLDITAADVALAKEIMRRKFMVGIFEWFNAGVMRFDHYFDFWTEYDMDHNSTIANCHYKLIKWGDHVGNYPKVHNEEETIEILSQREWADVELYHYAKTLFHEQTSLVEGPTSLKALSSP